MTPNDIPLPSDQFLLNHHQILSLLQMGTHTEISPSPS